MCIHVHLLHNCILHGFNADSAAVSIVPQSVLPKGSCGQLDDSHNGGLRTLTSFCSMNKSIEIMLLLAECSDTYLTLCSRHDVFRRKVDKREAAAPNLQLIPT